MSARAFTQTAPPLLTLFVVLLSFRLLNAALTQTFFQPDEFWQSLEVAHRIVFGYGYQTWEWRDGRTSLESARLLGQGGLGGWWQGVIVGSPIRSIAYPAIFVPAYWVLKALRLDDSFLLTLLPRLTQATFAAAGDFYTFRLAQRTTSTPVAYIWLILVWTSPYSLHTATRTFSNSLEASLMSAAVFYWPIATLKGKTDASPTDKRGGRGHIGSQQPTINIYAPLVLMALAFIIRPTSAILSIYLGLELVLLQAPLKSLPNLFLQVLLVGSGMLAWQTVLDSWFYGRLTVTALAFLQANVLGGSPVSLFYGAQPLHYYFTQGLPVIATVLTPWVLTGWVVCLTSEGARTLSSLREPSSLTALARASLWTTLCMSALGHKEWRFLQQLGPVWLLFAAIVISQQAREHSGNSEGKVSESSKTQQLPQTNSQQQSRLGQIRSDLSSSWETLSMAARKLDRTKSQLPASRLPGWSNRLLSALPSLRYLLLAQLPLSFYLLVGHGRGQMHVMRFLHETFAHQQSSGRSGTDGQAANVIKSVGFLMPCHSTPWQAWMHAPGMEITRSTDWEGSGDGGLAWFLTCEPPLHGQDLRTYRDQTRVFFEDPMRYLQARFPSSVDPGFPPAPFPTTSSGTAGDHPDWKHTWPSHLALFENLLDRKSVNQSSDQGNVRDFLREKGYAEVKRFWNGFGSDDENRWGDVLVLAWRDPESM